MLPQAYELPAAIGLILAGALACFAGYRVFRIVLGIYGLILGAAIASSIVSVDSTAAMVMAAVAGGLIGAAVMAIVYIVGIALVGAGLGALTVHLIWTRVATVDPPAPAVIVVSIAGAFGAMLLQRYVIIVGTAFTGAWTLIVANRLGGARPRGSGGAAGDYWQAQIGGWNGDDRAACGCGVEGHGHGRRGRGEGRQRGVLAAGDVSFTHRRIGREDEP
jgi:hypothetical protein